MVKNEPSISITDRIVRFGKDIRFGILMFFGAIKEGGGVPATFHSAYPIAQNLLFRRDIAK